MKKILKILLVLAVIVILGIAGIFYLTSGLVEQATAFFDAAKSKDYNIAYAGVSKAFKAATTQEQMISFLESNGLSDVKSTAWGSRSITTGEGKIEGTVTNNSGATIPLKISFVKEDGVWRINSIDKDQVGISDANTAQSSSALPKPEEAVALVQETMKVFAMSVNGKDFSPFYKYISPIWQKQITVQQLNDIFRTFIDNEMNLLPLQQVQPKFEPNPFLKDGVLVVQGSYPSKPSKVTFEFKYVKDGSAWKSVGVNMNVQPEIAEAPAVKEDVLDEEIEQEDESGND